MYQIFWQITAQINFHIFIFLTEDGVQCYENSDGVQSCTGPGFDTPNHETPEFDEDTSADDIADALNQNTGNGFQWFDL